MTTITIDLTKNPELAALVADKQPGDWIELRASIKAKDDQTLTARLETCDDCDKPETDDDAKESDKPEETANEQTDKAAENPGKSLAQKLTSASDPTSGM
jgi:hypothetical protein